MSEALSLSASLRTDKGTGASRRLRRDGRVPAILYGGRGEPVSLVLNMPAIKKMLELEAFYSQVISLDVDGKSSAVILKDLQRHPARGDVLHLDFQRIDASKELTTYVALHFMNEEECAGVKTEGGVLSHSINEVEVRCLPANIPEFIEVDVAGLKKGQTLHLTDLTMPEGVQLVQLMHGEGHDLAVVAVRAARKQEEDVPVEESATPEAEDKDKKGGEADS